MAWQFVWFLTLCLLMVAEAVASCPTGCSCSSAAVNTVSCRDAALTSPPDSIPSSTTVLDLSKNRFETLTETSFQDLTRLVNLSVSGNEIASISAGSFDGLRSLENLNASGNHLTNLNQATFEGARSSLQNLDLSKNWLTYIDGAFSGMSNLIRLDLSDNRLEAITEFTFRDQSSLRYLFLTGNRIQRLDKKAFRGLEKLLGLFLKGNPLHHVTRFYFSSLVLSNLDISECGLVQIPHGLPESVRYLQLRNNNLTRLERHSFRDSPKINVLILSENRIVDIDEETFDKMFYLQQLYLNNNRLKRIPMGLPPSLQRLLLDANQLDEVSDVFSNRSQLTTLSLAANNISQVVSGSLAKLVNLSKLDLSNNQLRRLRARTFSENARLDVLQLSKNPINNFDSLAFKGLVGLRALSLSYVPGTSVRVNSGVFGPTNQLIRLDLDSSPGLVRAILESDAILSSLESVQELSMLYTDLTTLPSSFPTRLINLTLLRISSAFWHCDSALRWLRDWLRTTVVRVDGKDELHCATPRELFGRAIITLGDSEFVSATVPPAQSSSSPANDDDDDDVEDNFDVMPIPDLNKPMELIPLKTTSLPEMSVPDEPTDIGGEFDQDTIDDNAIWEMLTRTTGSPLAGGNFIKSVQRPPPSVDEESNQHPVHHPHAHTSSGLPTTPEIVAFYPSDIPREEFSMSITRLIEVPPPSDGDGSAPSNDISAVHQQHPESNESHDSDGESGSHHHHGGGFTAKLAIIISVSTVGATLIIAGVIIALIVYICRRKRKSATDKIDVAGNERTIIKYKNKNGVLYFSTPSADMFSADGPGGLGSGDITCIVDRRIDCGGNNKSRAYKWEDL